MLLYLDEVIEYLELLVATTGAAGKAAVMDIVFAIRVLESLWHLSSMGAKGEGT